MIVAFTYYFMKCTLTEGEYSVCDGEKKSSEKHSGALCGITECSEITNGEAD